MVTRGYKGLQKGTWGYRGLQEVTRGDRGMQGGDKRLQSFTGVTTGYRGYKG